MSDPEPELELELELELEQMEPHLNRSDAC